MPEMSGVQLRRPQRLSLYQRLLGPRFHELSPQVRALHAPLPGSNVWTGEADVEHGHALLSRIAILLFGLPRAGASLPLTVTFDVDDEKETWTREFGTSVFRSTQWDEAGRLAERVGPAVLLMRPEAADGDMRLSVIGLRVLGVPMPLSLAPRIVTRAFDEAGRYRFDVEARLPLAGLLVRYRGWLLPKHKPGQSTADEPQKSAAL